MSIHKTLVSAALLFICSAPSSFSQTLNLRNVSVMKAMTQLQQKTGYHFVYEASDLDTSRKVNVNATGIRQIASEIVAGQDVTFEIQGKAIVISRNSKNQARDSYGNQVSTKKRKIVGTVSDNNGEPIIGATVKEKGTNNGTVTNGDGQFTLEVSEGALVDISYIGYKPQVRPASANMDIRMSEESESLNEVVVVGYGTQKKVNLTGAVQSVGEEVFDNRSLSNVSQALQGTVPNLNLSFEDGKPSRSSSFNIRGTTSIGQGGSALVLIDGVESDPSLLNPNDIESVSVLKDASSSAIYGARGAFGVVLITTKNAKKGKVTVNYTGNFNFESPTKKADFVSDGIEYAEHFREAWYNYYGNIPTALNGFQKYSNTWLETFKERRANGITDEVEVNPDGTYTYYGNTDWYDALFKDYTFAQDHNITVSGGNDKADFYISGRIYKYNGLYDYNPDTYRSNNFRAKGSLQALPWLKITNNMEYSNNKTHMPTVVSSAWTPQRFIELTAFPTMPMYNPDGTYTKSMAATLGGFIDGTNYINNRNDLFRNTLSMAASFLDNTVHFNADYTYRRSTTGADSKNYDVEFSEKEGVTSKRAGSNSISKSNTTDSYNAFNIFGDYENTFGKHYVKVMGGFNYENNSYDLSTMKRNGLLMSNSNSIAMTAGTSVTTTEKAWRWETAGVFFRVNYIFDNRYLFEANGRYDGSSKFPENDKWGFFPSVSLGWRISEEPWFKVSKNVISNLKVRGSYGSLGNGNVDPYSYMELFSFSQSSRVIGGAFNQKTSIPAVKPKSLTWEKVYTWDVGLDASFLNSTLQLTADYYVRETKDMYTVGRTLPDVFGASSPKGNYADMTTRGMEVALSYRNQFTLAGSPFHYNLRASVFDYYSKIDKYNNPNKNLSDYYVGMRVGEIWGYETDGLFQSDAETEGYVNTIMKSSNNGSWHAGDVKFVDRNQNGRIDYGDNTVDNPGDRKVIGNSQPRYQYSFGFDLEWKGIFLNAFFQGVGQQDCYPSMESNAFWGQYNRPYGGIPSWQIGNYWTADNPNAYLPRYSTYNSTMGRGGANYYNDRYLQDVSYLRLKNIQLGYNLPKTWTEAIHAKSCKVYVSGENLLCWSPFYKYVTGIDVMSIAGDTDTDLSSNSQGSGNNYPLLKSITLGVSITF